jgi:hypothetical protein
MIWDEARPARRCLPAVHIHPAAQSPPQVQHRAQALGTFGLFFNAIHSALTLPQSAERRRSTP